MDLQVTCVSMNEKVKKVFSRLLTGLKGKVERLGVESFPFLLYTFKVLSDPNGNSQTGA